MADVRYALKRSEFEDGQGFVVVRLSDYQLLSWRTLPKSHGIESINIVGEQFYNPGIRDPSFAPGARVLLEREPQNQFDPNAVAVWNAAGSVQAGYLPREDAKRLARSWGKGGPLRVYSIWETLDRKQRVGLRLLLLREGAPIDGAGLTDAFK
jgi:hypothetical protein